ncbi:MAG: hypothetical protein O2987_00115 [Firmicutes bacterium]|nr:hypothetical protein [Bacillota bacterium]
MESSGILNVINNIFGDINGFLQNLIQFDDLILGFYDQFIAPLPELVKIPGSVLLAVILVLGTIQFVKKMLKLFIVVAVILVIVLAMSS